jgi:hypothetical protein
MAQIQVMTGSIHRRRRSETEKRAIVAAAFTPGAIVSEEHYDRRLQQATEYPARCAVGSGLLAEPSRSALQNETLRQESEALILKP